MDKRKAKEDRVTGNSSSKHTPTMASIPRMSGANKEGETEEERISKMMSKSTEMYSNKHWVQYKGQKAFPPGAKPPPHWKCSKCLGNHWVSDCPFAKNDMKRTTGIPRSFLKPAESNIPGAKINPQGLIVVNEMEKQAYSQNKVERSPWLPDDRAPLPVKVSFITSIYCSDDDLHRFIVLIII